MTYTDFCNIHTNDNGNADTQNISINNNCGFGPFGFDHLTKPRTTAEENDEEITKLISETNAIVEENKTLMKCLKNENESLKNENESFKVILNRLRNDLHSKCEEVESLKMRCEENNYCVVTNQDSVRTVVSLLNSRNNESNINISKIFTKVIVYSKRARQYFECIKLYNGVWIEGFIYTNPVHTLKNIEIYE